MKHAKLMIAVVLLFALLLSSCGQAAPQAAETVRRTVKEAPAPTAAGRVELLSTYHEAPAAGTFALPLSAPGQVTPTTVEHNTMFRAKFEGNAVSGRGEVVDGVYRFAADKTDGEAWHVKLECNYPTVAGRDYRVTYRFRSDVAGKVKFGDFQEFDIHEGENSVTGVLIATSGTSYLDLQLGMLPAFTIDFTEIEIEEYADEVDYENALSVPVNFEKESLVWEKHDQGYAPVLTRSRDEVTVDYLATSWDNGVWKSRLYIKTGMIPESGVHYRVTADVSCDQDLPFEVLLNNGEEEKGYGALYGQSAAAGKTTTCEAVITGNGDGDELIMQFSLGDAPEGSTVRIGNLHVEKIKDHYTSVLSPLFALDTSVETGKMLYGAIPTSFKNLPLSFSYSGTDTVYCWGADGYVVALDESASSATLKISQAPESGREGWKAKLCAATGVTPAAGETYKVSFDVSATGDQAKFEVTFDGNAEKDYGAIYEGLSLTAGGTKSVEYTFTPVASYGPLTVQLQLGETNTTAGNTVTLSNLSIEKVTAEYKEVGTASLNTGSSGNVWEEHGDGIEQTVSASGNTATLSVTNGRSGGGVWSSRLFMLTGVTPAAGEKYSVSAVVSATAATGEFELLFSNSTTENDGYNKWGSGYGSIGGQSVAAGGSTTVSGVITVPAGLTQYNELALRFQFGNSPVNEISVSNIQIRKITSTGDTAVEMTGFAYPVTSGGETIHHDEAWEAETLSLTASADEWDESQATASASGNSATLSITQAHAAKEGSGVWSTIMRVATGVTPEAGKQYKVTYKISATEDPGVFEIKCNNGNNNDGGYAAKWNQHLSGETYTLEFTAPDAGCGELCLSFPMGNSPAPNTITVSDIKIEKFVPAYDEQTGGSTTPGSFHIAPDNDATHKATLTGDGSSATATINASALTDDWKLKLYANTNTELQAGKQYRIEMNVAGEGWSVDYKRTGGEGEAEFNGTDPAEVPNTVTPEVTGNLEIVLKIGKVAVGSSVKVSGIKITELGTETQGDNLMPSLTTGTAGNVTFWAHEDYAAAVSADGSSASLAINATPSADREDWKVKLFLNTGIALTAGKDYRISADVSSDKELEYAICYTDGVSDAKEHQVADTKSGLHAASAAQTVVCNASPTADATLNLQLNLGLASEPCTVTVSNVKVEEMIEGESEKVLPSFSYDSVGYVSRAADDGYVTLLEQGSSSATLHILQAPASDRNFWNVKFNVRTGFTPEKNKGYRVSYDLTAAKSQSAFEVFYDGNTESAYGAQYAQSLSSGKNSFAYIIYPGESKGELVLQLRCGKTDGTDGNTYTFSNLKIEECAFRYTQTPEVKKVTTLDTQNGYIEKLDVTRDKATVRIEKTPATGREAWKSKLFVETGVTLRPEQKYRVSMDVKSIIPAPFEVCFNNGGVEKGLGAIFGLISTPAGQHVEYVTYAKEATQLVIQLSLGNCSPPNSIILSNVKVEKAGAINLVSDTIYTF